MCRLSKNNKTLEISDVNSRIESAKVGDGEFKSIGLELEANPKNDDKLEISDNNSQSESAEDINSEFKSINLELEGNTNDIETLGIYFGNSEIQTANDISEFPIDFDLEANPCVSSTITKESDKPGTGNKPIICLDFEVRPSTSGQSKSVLSKNITYPLTSKDHSIDSDSDSSLGFGYDSDKDHEYIPDYGDESSSDQNETPLRKSFKNVGLSVLSSNNLYSQSEQFTDSLPTGRSVFIDKENINPDTQTNINLSASNIQSDSTQSVPLDIIGPDDEGPTPKKRARWSIPNPSQWKININKSKKKSGLPYLSKTGKAMSPKKPKIIDCSKCYYKCNTKFTEEDRKQICNEFTAASFEKQKDFILSRVKQSGVERKRRRGDSEEKGPEKKFSYVYTFVKNNEETRVCKNFFLGTLCISNGPLKTAFSGMSPVSGTFNRKDKRGLKTPPNKTSDYWIDRIKAHIESFVVMESHYCRKDTKKLYLDPGLSIRKMYELFQKVYENETVPKEWVYRNIFCTQYNMNFFTPSKDKCLLCKRFDEAKGEEKLLLQKDYDEHILRKKQANASKETDKKRANNDTTFLSATFDLQKVLQIPMSDAGPVYYSRKLCVYNLTVYEAVSPNKAYCFTWNECNGKRGSCEIGTCLLEWFNTLPSSVKHVSLFSDTCGGQNRNQFVAALFMYVVQNNTVEIIEHKFMESGHSKMEVDSMHAAIEYAQQNVPVFSMAQWTTIFAMARSNRNRNKKKEKKPIKDGYLVKEFQFNEFKDLKKLGNTLIDNRTKDSNGETVHWLKIKRLRYEKCKPNVILFSYDYESEYKELYVYKLQPGRPRKIGLEQLYPNQLPITEAKKKDLLKLCRTGVIPKEHHQWFSSMKSTKLAVPDVTPEPSLDEQLLETDLGL
jgi:hypothetical protein